MAEVGQALMAIMNRLIDDEAMTAEERARLKVQRQQLTKKQQALESAPTPTAISAIPEPGTPLGGQNLPVPSVTLRESCSQQGSRLRLPEAQLRGARGAGTPMMGEFDRQPASTCLGSASYVAGEVGYPASSNMGGAAGHGGERSFSGPVLGTCHTCGEPGHWAASCPQKGQGGGPGGFFSGLSGGLAGEGAPFGPQDGISSGGAYVEGEMRAPDPALRGGAGSCDVLATDCKWHEGTNDSRWSQQFPWSQVGCLRAHTTVCCLCHAQQLISA